jgi:hypothetical protein
MKKIRFQYEKKTYFATPIEDNPQKAKGDQGNLFYYRIYDENEKPIACITFFWSGSARDTLRPQFKDNEEELIYLFLIPHLPLYINSAKKIYTSCFRYVFNTIKEGLAANNSEYNIKIEDDFLYTRQKIIFGKRPSEEQIRKKVLVTLYNYWLDYPGNFIHICTLKLFLPVEEKILNRDLLFLNDEGLIKCQILDDGSISHLKILNPGIKYIESPSKFNKKQNLNWTQNFIRDNINISTSGKNSPIVINSQSIDIAFSEITAKIESKDFPNKQKASILLEELKSEVKKDIKDPNKIKKLLEKIKSTAPQINEKILKHPLIGPLISQILITKTIGESG